MTPAPVRVVRVSVPLALLSTLLFRLGLPLLSERVMARAVRVDAL